jgi:hypothetical protein
MEGGGAITDVAAADAFTFLGRGESLLTSSFSLSFYYQNADCWLFLPFGLL